MTEIALSELQINNFIGSRIELKINSTIHNPLCFGCCCQPILSGQHVRVIKKSPTVGQSLSKLISEPRSWWGKPAGAGELYIYECTLYQKIWCMVYERTAVGHLLLDPDQPFIRFIFVGNCAIWKRYKRYILAKGPSLSRPSWKGVAWHKG